MELSDVNYPKLKKFIPRGYLLATSDYVRQGLDRMPVRLNLLQLVTCPYGFMGSPFFLGLF